MHYIIQTNVYLFLFYGFYLVFLQKETFYTANRVYLVGSAVLSFGIPFWYSDYVQSLFITQKVNEIIVSLSLSEAIVFSTENKNPITWFDVLNWIYVSILVFFFLKLIFNFWELKKIIKSEQSFSANSSGFSSDQIEPKQGAFSFFRYIFVDKDLKNRETTLKHEFVHIKQLHSFDVILFEIIAVVCWFNPVVYFYKKAIKNIHEFIADEIASQNEPSKADYALLLLSHQFGVQLNISNTLTHHFFSKSTLKQRIEMLEKQRSKKVALIKYGFIVPLFMLMLVIASASIAKSEVIEGVEHIIFETEKPIEFIGNKNSGVNIFNSKKTIEFVESKNIEKLKGNITQMDTLIKNDEVFSEVEVVPTYQGGLNELYKAFMREIKYPQPARKANVQGKVFVQFIVEKDGTVTQASVLKGIGFGCNEEAIRMVMATSGKWEAGRQNGHKVRVKFTIPISFVIEGASKQVESTRLSEVVVATSPDHEIPVSKKLEDSKSYNFQLGGTNVNVRGKPYLNSEKPLFVVDGIPFKDGNISHIKPEDIQSITVLKNENAAALYGEQGKDGVVLITTKAKSSTIFTNFFKAEPLYLLEDKEITKEESEKINPDMIQEVNVLKLDAATKAYGEKGRNGVVIIKLKK